MLDFCLPPVSAGALPGTWPHHQRHQWSILCGFLLHLLPEVNCLNRRILLPSQLRVVCILVIPFYCSICPQNSSHSLSGSTDILHQLLITIGPRHRVILDSAICLTTVRAVLDIARAGNTHIWIHLFQRRVLLLVDLSTISGTGPTCQFLLMPFCIWCVLHLCKIPLIPLLILLIHLQVPVTELDTYAWTQHSHLRVQIAAVISPWEYYSSFQ